MVDCTVAFVISGITPYEIYILNQSVRIYWYNEQMYVHGAME